MTESPDATQGFCKRVPATQELLWLCISLCRREPYLPTLDACQQRLLNRYSEYSGTPSARVGSATPDTGHIQTHHRPGLCSDTLIRRNQGNEFCKSLFNWKEYRKSTDHLQAPLMIRWVHHHSGLGLIEHWEPCAALKSAHLQSTSSIHQHLCGCGARVSTALIRLLRWRFLSHKR